MIGRAVLSKSLLSRNLKNVADTVKQTKRNSGHGTWSYRMPPPPPPKLQMYMATGIGVVGYWWIFWHIFTEPGHITGEWPYVPPSTWTNEELGIPPDEKGSLLKH